MTTAILQQTCDLALYSKLPQRHGCVITKGKRVLAQGYNHSESRRVLSVSTLSVHSEMAALAQLRSRFLFDAKGIEERKAFFAKQAEGQARHLHC